MAYEEFIAMEIQRSMGFSLTQRSMESKGLP